jgi:hypothetical protein
MVTHSTEHSANLSRLRIATPCPIGWDEMTGDSQVRFCGHCQLIDTPLGTTIFNEKMIRSLPH